VVVDRLVKRYGAREAVRDLSFSVTPGEVFALLGPNGAGKTATVEILEGFRVRDGGQVRVLGDDPAASRSLRQRVGMMPQHSALYPHITVWEALTLFCSYYSQPASPTTLLETIGLADHAGARFKTLSGGEKQRLSLGLAMAGNPELMFLDEPTAAMDPQARQITWNLISSLRARGVTLLLTTHYLEEAQRLADRVAIIDHGVLVALGTPADLTRRASGLVRFITSPLPRATLVLAKVLSSAVLIAFSCLLLAVVSLGLYGMRTEGNPLSALIVLAIGVAAFAAIGIALEGSIAVDGAAAVTNAIYLPLLFLGGSFIPVNKLPLPLEDLAWALPPAHLVRALDTVLVRGQSLASTGWDLPIVAAWGLAAILAASRWLSWE
jgi:ABC-2 type transport system ATP-binding protein